jgi:hypothetical protein
MIGQILEGQGIERPEERDVGGDDQCGGVPCRRWEVAALGLIV